MINTKLQNKLTRINYKTIKKYLDFWEFNSIEFDLDFSEEVSFLKDECVKLAYSLDNKKKLIVRESFLESDDENVEYISLSQLIYDLDVFCNIPEEISKMINKQRFCSFANSIFLQMKNNGWFICFSNKGVFYHLFKDNNYPIIDDELCFTENKVYLVNCGDEEKTNSFYKKHIETVRTERIRELVLFREWLIFEIYSYFKELLGEKGVNVYLANWEWAQNNILYPKQNISSMDRELRNNLSIYNISENEKQYEQFLKEFYGSDYSLDYVRNVMDIPLRNYYGIGCIHHADKTSEYLNVSIGERKTSDCPEKYNNTVHMLGGCVFFGYAIDDSKTIASFLQRKINTYIKKNSFRVSNKAIWGGNIDETYNTFYESEFKKGDIVLISYAGLTSFGDFDISKGLAFCNTNHEFYFDGLVHCNAEGYEAVADRIFELIEDDLEKESVDESAFRIVRDKRNVKHDSKYDTELNNYLDSIKNDLPPLFEKDKTYGCAVMNCNPFTLGHRYLIETAAKQVDYLIVFVVEENKSYFPFEDRIMLVKQGTADLKNVYVVPSGNLIISAVTFPGYFLKDNPEKSVIDSSSDVEIFGRYIAPALGITKRFVGEEPTDIVTNHYNETMKSFLPQFGIELIIIRRKQSGSVIISASTVRKYLKKKDFDAIQKFVPETTFSYLVKRFGEEE